MQMRIGPTTLTVVRAPFAATPTTRKGYARAAGVHFDIGGIKWIGFDASTIRLRESDTEWPECIGGYLRSDLLASQALQDHARNVARIDAIRDEVVSAEVQVRSGASKPIEDLDAYLAAPNSLTTTPNPPVSSAEAPAASTLHPDAAGVAFRPPE